MSGLWGFWNSVTSNNTIKAAVSTARNVTDLAVAHVTEHGLVNSVIDGASAAVNSVKKVDNDFLSGALGKLVEFLFTPAPLPIVTLLLSRTAIQFSLVRWTALKKRSKRV